MLYLYLTVYKYWLQMLIKVQGNYFMKRSAIKNSFTIYIYSEI